MKRIVVCVLAVMTLTTGIFAQKSKVTKEKDKDQYSVNKQGNQKITNGPVIEYTSDHSAMAAWSTKEPGGTYIAYGTDKSNLNQRTEKAWGGTNHRLEIKNLKPSTTYYFQVRSEDAKGSGADVESNVDSFTTLAKGQQPDKANHNLGVNGSNSNGPTTGSSSGMGSAAITNGPVLEYVSSKDAVIAWSSQSGSDMSIRYGTDRNSLSMSGGATENKSGTNHRAKLGNLKPSTTYYFQMMQGGQPLGEIEQFQTVAQGAPPQRQNVNLGAHAGK